MKTTILSTVFLLLFIPAFSFAQDAPSDAEGAGGVIRPGDVPGQLGTPTQPRPGQLGYPTSRPINSGQEVSNQRMGATSGSKNLAAQCSAIKFKSLIDILIWLKCIAVAVLIPLIFALAFVLFLWGVLKFMYSSDKPKREEAKKLVWWGLVGLFVMVSVWGILKIASTTLGIDPMAVPLLQTTYLDVNKASK